MAIRTYTSLKNEMFEVDDSRNIGKPGGEGAVYEIKSPKKYKKDYCAKIYHDRVLSSSATMGVRENKIKYMVKHPISTSNSSVRICAPIDMLYLNGIFVGFIMLKAFDESEQLTWISTGYDLTSKKIYPKLSGFDGSEGMRSVYNRLVVSNNIAYAIALLHRTKHYVLVDTKPENILITANGNVSLIDMDSVQIVDSRGLLKFKSTVYSEQYAPLEFHKKKVKIGVDTIMPSWDSFSFGVMAYELIIGCHPYIGTYRAPFNKGTDTLSNIVQGLFLNGSKQAYLENPTTLKLYFTRWESLPKELRDAFYRAFETGQAIPSKRPTMEEWGSALSKAISEIQPFLKKNRNKIAQSKTPTIAKTSTSTVPANLQSQPEISTVWYVTVSLIIFLLFLASMIN